MDIEDPKAKSALNAQRAQRILTEGRNSSVELERVIRELNVSIQLVPKDIECHMNLAEAYKRAYDWSSAVFSLRFVLHALPRHAKAGNELRDVYISLAKEMIIYKRYDDAVAHLKNAVKYDPKCVRAWNLLAKCFVYLSDFKSAVEAIGRSISLAGATTVDLYIFRAKLYWALGLEEPGNADMRRALDMDKTHPEVVSFLDRSFRRAQRLYEEGMAQLEDGQPEEALKLMERALLLSSDDIKLYLTIAKLYRLVGNLDKALFTLQDAVQIYRSRNQEDAPPEEEETLSGSETSSDGENEDDDGANEEASLNDNDSRATQKPKIPEIPPLLQKQLNLVYNDMALKLAEEGEYHKALNLYNKIVTAERERSSFPGSDPFDYRYFMNRGDCYRAIGENFYASSDYHSALEINPDIWELRTKLSLLHYQAGVDHFNSSNFKASTNELNEALRLNDRVCEYYLLRGRANY